MLTLLIRLLLCYLNHKFLVNHGLYSCEKLPVSAQTFYQSLYNTIYLRFSFKYLFENFIIVSLHMCIRYFFHIILFFLLISSDYFLLIFLHWLQMFSTTHCFSSPSGSRVCTQNLRNLHIPCFNLKKENSENAGVQNRAHCYIFQVLFRAHYLQIATISCFRKNKY